MVARGRWPMLIIEHYNGETTKISIKHGWERNSWELIVNADDDSSRTVFPIMGNVKSYTVVKRSRQAILDERVRDLAHDVRSRTCKHGSKLATCATCVLDDKDFRDYSQQCKHGAPLSESCSACAYKLRKADAQSRFRPIILTELRNIMHSGTITGHGGLSDPPPDPVCPHVPPGYPACRHCTPKFDCIHGSPPCASCEDMTCTHGGHPAICVHCAESPSNPTVRPPR
jgi:hypothetical protein